MDISFIEQYALGIGFGLIILALIIFSKTHFKYQKRLTIVIVSMGLLFLAYYFGPSLGFTIDIKKDLPYFLFISIGNAITADILFKRKLDL